MFLTPFGSLAEVTPFKGGPEPFEKESHEFLGSKRIGPVCLRIVRRQSVSVSLL